MKCLSVLAVASLCLLLSSCVPATVDSRPKVAVLNGPAEFQVDGLADVFVEELKFQPEAIAYGFTRRSRLDYFEDYRNFVGSRAVPSAALAARSQGASVAVMIGLDGDEDVSDVDVSIDEAEIRVEFRIEGRVVVTLIEPQTAQRLGTFVSPEFRVYRTRRVDLDLPEGVERDSSEGRAIIRKQVDKVRDEMFEGFIVNAFTVPLLELAQPVASELARLVEVQGEAVQVPKRVRSATRPTVKAQVYLLLMACSSNRIFRMFALNTASNRSPIMGMAPMINSSATL